MAALTENLTYQSVETNETAVLRAKTTLASVIKTGSLVELDLATGFVGRLGTATNGVFIGQSVGEYSLAADTETRVGVWTGGKILERTSNGTDGVSIAGLTSQAQVGAPVYCATDNPADATLIPSGQMIGHVAQFVSTGRGYIKLMTLHQALERVNDRAKHFERLCLGIFDGADITAADLVTSLPLDGNGRIVRFFAVVLKVTTDTDADAVINLEIGTTDLTGGVLTIADVNDATNPLDTKGEVKNATAITGNNLFQDGDTLSVEASGVTAFSDGRIALYAVIERF